MQTLRETLTVGKTYQALNADLANIRVLGFTPARIKVAYLIPVTSGILAKRATITPDALVKWIGENPTEV